MSEHAYLQAPAPCPAVWAACAEDSQEGSGLDPGPSSLQQIRDGGIPCWSQDQGLGASRRCGSHEAEDRRCRAGESYKLLGEERTPTPPNGRPLQTGQTLRTGGAQDSSTQQSCSMSFSPGKRGTRSTASPGCSPRPAGTEAKHLRDLTPGTQVSPHQHPHLPLWSRHPQSSLQIPSFTQSKASSLEYVAQPLLQIGLRPQL